MDLPDYYYKCNQDGKGYRIKNNVVTKFEERVVSLNKNNVNYKSGETTRVTEAGITVSKETERSCSNLILASGCKRKGDGEAENGGSTNKIKKKVKRITDENNDANNAAVEEDETFVEDSVFSNDLLLRTIFTNLSVSDLKSSRQVNRLWNLEATKILQKRGSLAPIQISHSTVFLLDAAAYKRPIPLQDFRTIVENSVLFPVASFAVGDDPLSQDVIYFFRDHGHLVTSFCFQPKQINEAEEDDATSSEILLLAAINFPNLENLKIIKFDEEGFVTASFLMAIENSPEMKNLHILELSGFVPSDVISQILIKAKNLKNIYLHPCKDYDYSTSLEALVELENVIPRLKNIHWFVSEEALEIYQQVLEQSPKFSRLETINSSRFQSISLRGQGQCLTEMFTQCSESLTEFLDVRYLGNIPGLHFPVLPNVKRMGVRLECLSLGFDFPQLCPNLTILEVEGSDGCAPEDIFDGPLSPTISVRHLQVKWEERYIPDNWVKALCSIFTNVTSVKFCNIPRHSAYGFIWKLNKLQELHVAVGTKPGVGISLMLAMDSAFTGFSVETVAELFRKDPADVCLSAEEVDALRIKPSIVELKELRKLSLRLFDATINENEDYSEANFFGWRNVEVIFERGECRAFLHVDAQIILSCVSKRFGFDLCPRLESNVSARLTHYTQLNA